MESNECAPETPTALLDGNVHGEGAMSQVLQGVQNEFLGMASNDEIKEEMKEALNMEDAAKGISLFNLDSVETGMVEIDSSSGSSSSSSSDDESSADEPVVTRATENRFSEVTPEDCNYAMHRKSSIVHKVPLGSTTSQCKVHMNQNFKILEGVLRVKLPKCLNCFPKETSRIRSVDDLAAALERSVQRRTAQRG